MLLGGHFLLARIFWGHLTIYNVNLPHFLVVQPASDCGVVTYMLSSGVTINSRLAMFVFFIMVVQIY